MAFSVALPSSLAPFVGGVESMELRSADNDPEMDSGCDNKAYQMPWRLLSYAHISLLYALGNEYEKTVNAVTNDCGSSVLSKRLNRGPKILTNDSVAPPKSYITNSSGYMESRASLLTNEASSAMLIGTTSTKMNYLITRLIALNDSKEKSLVFTNYRNVLYYVCHALSVAGVRWLAYHRGDPWGDRAQSLTTFNTTDKVRVFIMETRRAAYGITLTAASRIFFLDPEWDPSVEAQAIKRAHRIGQTLPVVVEKIVISGSVEEDLLRSTTRGHDPGDLHAKRVLSSLRYIGNADSGDGGDNNVDTFMDTTADGYPISLNLLTHGRVKVHRYAHQLHGEDDIAMAQLRSALVEERRSINMDDEKVQNKKVKLASSSGENTEPPHSPRKRNLSPTPATHNVKRVAMDDAL